MVNQIATALAISAPSSATAGRSFQVTVTAEDGGGNVVTSYSGTVHFTSSDPAAGLPTNYTFTGADDGSHTFTVNLADVGSQSITVGDTSTSALTATSTITVGVGITTGWNLIDLPLQGSALGTTSALVSSLTGALSPGSISAVATYSSGQFHLFVPGYSTDLSLDPSSGFFVLSTSNGTWMQAGTLYTAAQAVTLNPGWNLVAAPYPLGGLTGDAINAELGSQCGLQEVATYQSGSYGVYTPAIGPSGSGFHVPPTAGMWVLCTNAYSWTPA